jgi:hypothetical protein
MRSGGLLVGLVLSACSTTYDACDAAERSLLAQDLPGAIVAFDTVPVEDKRYPEARAAALTVEHRMRRGHEILLQALLLRGEWRDDEAIEVLHHARSIWPRMPGVDAMISATEHRAKMLRKSALTKPISEPPVELPMPVPEAATQSLEGARPLVDQESAPEVQRVAWPGGQDPVMLGLAAVETRLGSGDLEAAVAELIELSRRWSDDVRVSLRLASVLHQRALQRYGQGHLAGAIVDWERVAVLNPRNTLAKTLLAAVRAEVALAVPPK